MKSLLDYLNAEIRKEHERLSISMTYYYRDLPRQEYIRRARDEWNHLQDRIAPMVRQRDWIIEQLVTYNPMKRPQPTILISIDE